MSKNKKVKKPVGTSQEKKLSSKSLSNTSNLKKQVEQVKELTMDSIKKMSENPDISFDDFKKGINKAAKAFKLMYIAIYVGDELKKLKDEK